MSVLVSGSIGIDNVKTAKAFEKELLGGSAAYAALASSYFSPTFLVGVVGEDFPKKHREKFEKAGVNIDGLEVVKGGQTFRWTGEYSENMNDRETLEVDLNVLEHFEPKIPASAAEAKIILLANQSPNSQLMTVSRFPNASFIIADTMDLWIKIARHELEQVLNVADLLVLNDSEAKLLANTDSLIGTRAFFQQFDLPYVVIKKGEHGALVFGANSNDVYFLSSHPLEEVLDPTGAGDSFVGALAGYLASLNQGNFEFDDICRGVLYGTVVASFNCESFSVNNLLDLSKSKISERLQNLVKINTPPAIS